MTEIRLGKKDYEYDERTLMLASFLAPEIYYPGTYDFDKKRKAFPLDTWGNDQWGNCVKVGQANQTIRLERLEQRRTLPLKSEHVIQAYKDESVRQFQNAPVSPGDANDQGLVVLWNLRNWRNLGWDLDFSKSAPPRNYTISAYGELDTNRPEQIKQAIYLLHGVQLGFGLPLSVAGEFETWDVGGSGNTAPGSWGGHLVYCKSYDPSGMTVLSWGMEIYVTNAFLVAYCDEAWAVVDNFDHWRRSSELDIEGLTRYLRDIGAIIG